MAEATLPNSLSSTQPSQAANDDFIERFVAYLRTEKGLAPLTIEAYRSDLSQLARFLGKRKLIAARREDVGNYVGHLLAAMSARSAARKVVTLRQFFKFLSMDRFIVADPMLRIESPKGWKVLPKFLAPPEIETALNMETNAHGYLTRRNHAILELLFASGLRASEIIAARMVDLNLADRGPTLEEIDSGADLSANYSVPFQAGNGRRGSPCARASCGGLQQFTCQKEMTSVS